MTKWFIEEQLSYFYFRTEFEPSKECPMLLNVLEKLAAVGDSEEESRKVGRAFFDAIGLIVAAYSEATESATLFTATTQLISEDSEYNEHDDYIFRGLPVQPHSPKPKASERQEASNYVDFSTAFTGEREVYGHKGCIPVFLILHVGTS